MVEVAEASLPEAVAEEEGEVDSHPEVVEGEDQGEAVVAAAEGVAVVVEEAGEVEPKLSSSLTDTRACSSLVERRMRW